MALLRDEEEAKTFVAKIGIERAESILNAICSRIKRRIDVGNRGAVGFRYDESSIRRTDIEINLMHKLKMGLSLLDTSNKPCAAHQRILQRIAARKQAVVMKKNKNCAQALLDF